MIQSHHSFELAYVGSIVPDTPPFNAVPPFSRSANLYQTQLLGAMAQAGVRPSLILSYMSVVAFPSGERLWLRARRVTDAYGNVIQVLGFPNITPLKQLWMGGAAFLRLSAWSFSRRHRPRVIHAYNLTTPAGVCLWLAARITGAKLSVSLCDVDVPGQTTPNTLWFRLDHWMHGFLIPRLDGRVVVADAIARDFAPDKHYLRVEGGVGDELVARTEGLSDRRIDRTDGIDGIGRTGRMAPFRLVAVGGLNETNGFDLILEAMSLLGDVDVVLDIAGYGPLASLVEAAAARDPRITMHGFQSLDGVIGLYEQADLLLVIRRTQTRDTRYFFPGKLMESLLSGVRVLATKTGHLEKEYGECLYLLDEETARGLADRVRAVIQLPAEARAKLAKRARSTMLAAKTWRLQAQKLVTYLGEKVVTNRG